MVPFTIELKRSEYLAINQGNARLYTENYKTLLSEAYSIVYIIVERFLVTNLILLLAKDLFRFSISSLIGFGIVPENLAISSKLSNLLA